MTLRKRCAWVRSCCTRASTPLELPPASTRCNADTHALAEGSVMGLRTCRLGGCTEYWRCGVAGMIKPTLLVSLTVAIARCQQKSARAMGKMSWHAHGYHKLQHSTTLQCRALRKQLGKHRKRPMQRLQVDRVIMHQVRDGLNLLDWKQLHGSGMVCRSPLPCRECVMAFILEPR